MINPTWNSLDAFSFRIYLLSGASITGSTRQVRSRRTKPEKLTCTRRSLYCTFS